jgi:hypothetical protein
MDDSSGPSVLGKRPLDSGISNDNPYFALFSSLQSSFASEQSILDQFSTELSREDLALVRDADGSGLVHRIAARGFLNLMDIALKFGCDVNSTDRRGRSPAFYCLVLETQLAQQCIQYLFSRGANPRVEDRSGRGLMQAAIDQSVQLESEAHALALIPLLRSFDVPVDSIARVDTKPSLMFVLKHGMFSVARMLVDHGASVHWQVKEKSTGVKLLWRYTTAIGWGPLHFAAACNQLDLVTVCVNMRLSLRFGYSLF